MPALIWTPQALADLTRLHRFLAERNPEAACRAVRAIREGVRMARRHSTARAAWAAQGEANIRTMVDTARLTPGTASSAHPADRHGVAATSRAESG